MSTRFITQLFGAVLGAVALASGAQAQDARLTAPVLHPVPFPPIGIFHPVKFPTLDPNSGRPIADTETLTLPTGAKIQAGAFYKQLNELEDTLNTQGRSLKDTAAALGTVDTEMVNRSALNATSERLMTASRLNESAIRRNPILAREIVQPGVARGATTLETLKVMKIDPIATIFWPRPIPVCSGSAEYYKPWGMGLENNFFGAYMGASLDVKGWCDHTEAHGDAYSSGKVFGVHFDLIRGNVDATATKGQDTVGDIDVKVLGYDVYRRDFRQPSLDLGDRYSQQVSYGGEFRFMVGPIPVDVQYGVAGSAAFGWKLQLGPTWALAQGHPGASTWVYAQGGVDIVLAGAYVGADLTLLAFDMYAQGLMEIVPRDGHLQLHGNIWLSYAVSTLSGDVYVEAYAYVPRWGIPPWEKKTWRANLFSWGGFRDNQILVNEDYWKALT